MSSAYMASLGAVVVYVIFSRHGRVRPLPVSLSAIKDTLFKGGG